MAPFFSILLQSLVEYILFEKSLKEALNDTPAGVDHSSGNNTKPQILFIVAFANFKSKYRFFSGNYVSDTISIRRINAYFHPKVNSFFSSGATYTGEAKKVYQYRIGYYYEYGKDLIFIKEATDSLETAIDLGDIINKTSYYDYSEFASGESLVFTRQARENLGKLHFMVFASTTKEEDDDFDIEIDCPIDFTSF